MKRRRFLTLAAASSVPLAGCSGSDEPEVRTVTVTVTKTRQRTPTSSTEGTPRQTTSQPTRTRTTTEETNTEETTTEETTTETTTETIDHEAKAASLLADAQAKIKAAYALYVDGDLGDSMLVEITAASDDFAADEIEARLREAGNALREARPHATTAQLETLSKLTMVVRFLRYTARAQTHLIEAHRVGTRLSKQLASGNTAGVKATATKLPTVVSKAETHQRKASRMGVDGYGQFPFLAKFEMEDKQEQLHLEQQVFDRMKRACSTLPNAVENLSAGRRDYVRDSDFHVAEDEFGDAGDLLGDAHQSYAVHDPPNHLADFATRFGCYLESLMDYAYHLEEAARAAADDESWKREEGERKATRALKACENEMSPPAY